MRIAVVTVAMSKLEYIIQISIYLIDIFHSLIKHGKTLLVHAAPLASCHTFCAVYLRLLFFFQSISADGVYIKNGLNIHLLCLVSKYDVVVFVFASVEMKFQRRLTVWRNQYILFMILNKLVSSVAYQLQSLHIFKHINHASI